MKSFIKIMAVALVAVALLSVLASCGATLSGTYEEKELGLLELTFDGNKVVYKALGVEVEGEYEIKGDEIILSLPGTSVNGSFSFKKSGDTITIDGIQYIKK